jgi:hypothetical protein
MQVENRNSYNPLGRMGPLYPRPEYRPPQPHAEGAPDGAAEGAGKGAEGKGQAQTESIVLSPRLKRASGGAPAEASGRLNAQSARALAEATAESISGLNPRAERGCPHRRPEGHGLLYPVYA